mmetsp:Transcript_113631/g.328135  ORF Transcript_113631/g.328135 Transcript_113631/m.328135 type:complete len:287 (+) Transcript_113631:357-1217(+)
MTKQETLPKSRLGLFLRASLFNHSEKPNATWLVAGSVIVVRAAQVIRPGEEVLISYWPDIDADDAMRHGLLEGFGMSEGTLGEGVPELTLSEEQREGLAQLKRLPGLVATKLGACRGGDVAAAFDSVASFLQSELVAAEQLLPKTLRAFLEPRLFQAQITLQQAAILSARGDSDGGEKLRLLAMARWRGALNKWEGPWSKRVLLRLLFALKGALRPAPAEMLAAWSAGAEGEASQGPAEQDFSIELARQARLSPEAVKSELERAAEDVFGASILAQAILAKCGIAE